MHNINSSVDLAREVRILTLDMIFKSRSSHIASAYSMTDIISVLYYDFLSISPDFPEDPNRDIFILSKGHACSSLYALLALRGFYDLSELETFGKNNSIFMTHISHKVKGVEFSTGSLGHGLPFATGKALGSKIMNKNNNIFVLVGDGELDEGSNWEALLFASHHKLDNLTIIVDYNNLQSLTSVAETLNLEPLEKKFEAFGCNVFLADGHNHNQLNKIFKYIFTNRNNKPNILIAKTLKGKGVSFMENVVQWHYTPPNDIQYKMAFNELRDA